MTYEERLLAEIASVEEEISIAKEQGYDEDLQTLEAWIRALNWALNKYKEAK